MSKPRKVLTVALAFITIMGMTAVLAGTGGAAFSGADTPGVSSLTGDDPEQANDKCNNPGNSDEKNPNCPDEGDDPGEGDDPDEGEDPGEAGTCEEGGAAQDNTIANEAFGTENEDGPISSQVHENEEQFQDGEPVVHEGSCVVATVDNNAPDNGGDGDDGNESNPVEDAVGELQNATEGDGNETDQIEDAVGELQNATEGDGNESNPVDDVTGELQNATEGDDGNESNPVEDAAGELQNATEGDGNETEQIEEAINELQNATEGEEPPDEVQDLIDQLEENAPEEGDDPQEEFEQLVQELIDQLEENAPEAGNNLVLV